MARRPPRRYEPGELDKVRKNLGDISEDEARRMSEILGGEIGLEKSELDHPLKRKHGDQEHTYKDKKLPSEIYREKRWERMKKGTSKSNDSKDKKKKALSYIDKVRIAFLCHRSEYGITSLAGTIGAFFSFFLPFPDKVKSSFIKKIEKKIYQPIYELVKATRGLYTKTRREIYDQIEENLFYIAILRIIKRWDIDSIEMEVSHLKKKASECHLRNILRLCKMVYYPLILLSKVDVQNHILGSYKWAFGINTEYYNDNAIEKNRIISLYYDAEKNLPKIFDDIKRILYPFLLQNFDHSFYLYEEFLVKEHEHILSFLGISESDILNPDELLSFTKDQLSRKEEEEAPPPQEEKEENIYAQHYPESLVKGFQYLEKLYPKAGWENLREFPDLYAYFHPLYQFQNGVELIPPFDPLLQILVLLSILNDLFYGFRHIQFGVIRDEEQQRFHIQEKMDSFVSVWPFYIDELISKAYASRLADYCRRIDSDKGFKTSEVGKKIVLELNWIKKHYLIPYQSLKFENKVTGIVKRQIPQLYILVPEIRKLLTPVIAELRLNAAEGKKAQFESILNPWGQYLFDLENNTSMRLNKLLYIKDKSGKIIDKRNNANLLFFTAAILNVLDYMINNKESHLYYPPSQKLFRTIHSGSDVPQYSVETVDPTLLETELPDPDTKTKAEPVKLTLKDAIEQKVQQYKKNGFLFSLIYFQQGEIKELTDEEPIPAVELLKINIRPDKDILLTPDENTFLLLMENCDLKMAIGRTKEMLNKLDFFDISTGIIQYDIRWNFDHFLKILEKTKHFAQTQGAGKIVFLDMANNKFKSISA